MPFQSELSVTETDASLTEFLFPFLEANPSGVAFCDAKAENSVTYGELKTHALNIASYLTRKGLVKGDSVCIYSANHIFFTSVVLGCAYAGIIVSTSSKDLQAREVALQLADCKAKILFTTSDKKEVVTSIKEQYSSLSEVVLFTETESSSDYTAITDLLSDDGSAAPSTSINSREDVLILPYSSGTTGLPKGVMLTHYNVVNNIVQTNASVEFDNSDVFLAVLPFTHIYALALLSLGAVSKQIKVVVVPKFVPGEFLTCIQTHRVTCLHIVPPIVVFLAKHPVVANFDLSSVKRVLSGAAPLGEELGLLLKNRMRVDLLQGYGMTELSPVATVSPPNNSKLASCGKLVANTQGKIVNPEGKEVAQGERGELCISGPQVMKGYFNNPSATSHTVDSDGWLHTGDVALIDADGYIFVVDRVKELIKYKGFQVAPAELEALLLGHAGVADVAVIGKPDEKAGELPMAFVVRAANSNSTEEEIQAFLVEQGIAHYKQLRGGVCFVTKIPKSASGKILRRVLRDQLAQDSA